MRVSRLLPVLMLGLSSSFARGDDKALTLAQCMQIASGLNALNYAGAQLGGGASPADAKQYKLGSLRITIGLYLAALQVPLDGFEKGKRALYLEVGEGKPIDKDSPQMTALVDKIQDRLEGPCNVTLPHIKGGDLRIGDGPDQNQIPPGVISALAPIIDP
jgi:hypothetical protein